MGPSSLLTGRYVPAALVNHAPRRHGFQAEVTELVSALPSPMAACMWRSRACRRPGHEAPAMIAAP